MKKAALLCAAMALAGCQSNGNQQPQNTTVFDANGQALFVDKLANLAPAHHWRCTDRAEPKPRQVLFEVAYSENNFGNRYPNGGDFGLVAMEPGKAQVAQFTRNGLDLVWKWGDFTLVMQPNGDALYYNFTGVARGESIRPSAIYECFNDE